MASRLLVALLLIAGCTFGRIAPDQITCLSLGAGRCERCTTRGDVKTCDAVQGAHAAEGLWTVLGGVLALLRGLLPGAALLPLQAPISDSPGWLPHRERNRLAWIDRA